MKSDLLIKLPENAGDDFTIKLLFMTDDNFVASARTKSFPGPFKAKSLEAYLADWTTWAKCTGSELSEIRRVRASKPTLSEKTTSPEASPR